MKKYFLAAVLMMAFAGIAGAQTTEKTKTKNAVAKTSTKSPTAPSAVKTAGMQSGDNKTTVTKQKVEPNKTKTTKTTSPAIKHHKKKKPKKKAKKASK